jgi:hypothetical protein
MNTENLRVVKLVNGEDIVCELMNTTEGVSISVSNPILLHQVRVPMGRTIVDSYVLSSWLPLSVDEAVDIAIRNIIVVSKPKESLSFNYTRFMETLAEEKKEIEQESNNEPDGTDIHELIDKFINNFENEEQNDDINPARYTRSGKTIH